MKTQTKQHLAQTICKIMNVVKWISLAFILWVCYQIFPEVVAFLVLAWIVCKVYWWALNNS